MIKKYKPCSRKELRELVKDESICLGDIDTSLISPRRHRHFADNGHDGAF